MKWKTLTRLRRILQFRFTLLILGAAIQVQAASREGAWDQIFRDTQDTPIRVRDLKSVSSPNLSSRSVLLVFWASWCGPCREEMAFLKTKKPLGPHASAPQPTESNEPGSTAQGAITSKARPIEIILINVDDEGGWSKAQGLLNELQWDGLSLRDPSGSYFFEVQSSGELPFSLLFNNQGRLVAEFDKLDEQTWVQVEERAAAEVKTADAQSAKAETAEPSQELGPESFGARWEILNQSRFHQRKNSTQQRAEVLANILTIKRSLPAWELGVAHNLIRQKPLSQSQWTRWEDELGPTYVEHRGGTDYSYKLRAGDDTHEWAGGELLSVRPVPMSDESVSVLGAHTWLSQSKSARPWTLQIMGGQIRRQLFGAQLDPTRDLTVRGPREEVVGALGSYNLLVRASQESAALHLGWVQYNQRADSALGYPSEHSDQRGTLGLRAKFDGLNLFAQTTQYQIAKSSRGSAHPSSWSWRSGLNTSWSGLQTSVDYLEREDQMPRTFLPALVEDPAVPLSLTDSRQTRFYFQTQRGESLWDGALVREEVRNRSQDENQNTVQLGGLHPGAHLKWIVGSQWTRNPAPRQEAQMTYGRASGEWEPFFYQATAKNYYSQGSGLSAAVPGGLLQIQVGGKLTMLSNLKGSCALTRTEQSGYFLSTSGLDDRVLTSVRVGAEQGLWALRLASGMEPGGTVCSGGTCAQRPPLNGISAELDLQASF